MQPFDPAGVYPVDQVLAELRFSRGIRHLSFRYDLLDSQNRYQGTLGNVLGGSVDNNALADIKRTAKFTMVDTGAVNFLRDRIQPWAVLTMPDAGTVEWPLGVFLLTTPTRTLVAEGGYVGREVEAYDQLLALRDDKVVDRYTVAAGVAYTAAIATMLGGAYTLNLTPSTLTLPAAMEWEPGTTYLRIVNDLLAAINYESASFDERGRLVCRPYQSPVNRSADYTYATDDDSVIAGDIDQTLDLFAVPNRWVLVVSEPDRPALTATYTNTSPASPTSTVGRGRTIVDFRDSEDAADLVTLQAKAARYAFEASQVFEVVEFETAVMPIHGNADVLELAVNGLGIGAKYSEHAWSMPLQAGGTMSHKVRRVVTV